MPDGNAANGTGDGVMLLSRLASPRIFLVTTPGNCWDR